MLVEEKKKINVKIKGFLICIGGDWAMTGMCDPPNTTVVGSSKTG